MKTGRYGSCVVPFGAVGTSFMMLIIIDDHYFCLFLFFILGSFLFVFAFYLRVSIVEDGETPFVGVFVCLVCCC